VINSGSPSGEYQRIDPPPGHAGGSGLIKRIGEPERCATRTYAGSTTAFAALITGHGRAVRITQEWFDDAGAGWRRRDGCRRAPGRARCGPVPMTWLTAVSTNEVGMVSRSHGRPARCRPIFGDGSSAS